MYYFRLNALSVSDNTELSHWVRRHAIYKILAGEHYEDLLQTAVMLAVGQKHGGLVFHPDLPQEIISLLKSPPAG